MKKILLSLAICVMAIAAICQSGIQDSKNKYTIGFNRSFLTTGDGSGFHLNNEYQLQMTKRLGLGVGFGMLYSAKESTIILEVEDYENNLISGDWIFTVEDGTKILKMKTDQQTYIHIDLLINYLLVKFNKITLDVITGGSVAYISNSYLTRWELGTFNGNITGEQNIQLYYPYYSRLIDLGVFSRISTNYQVSDKLSFGIVGGIYHYFKSAYRFYDYGISMGIRF
ncbi:MAG TPA: hypothetical protein VJ203_04645 [Bacteroidales bacterium]|nr:hypothetical protein [Bacteroidales bacterium]